MDKKPLCAKKNGELIFTLFADMHYKKGMYLPSVQDMEKILDRAHENNSDFVIHVGDLCNDYLGSPELVNAYLHNRYGLLACGVYGNHELETKGNTMAVVTPLLCSLPEKAVFGTADGRISPEIGYYYFDIKGFRMICLDTNYSYNEALGVYEHNKEGSWGSPKENTLEDSLGPQQLSWLETVLTKSAEEGVSCVLFSHASFVEDWEHSPEWETVGTLIKKANDRKKRTVVMVVNGHYHEDACKVLDNVLYLNTNVVRNGFWGVSHEQHYLDGQTFLFTDYDKSGRETRTYEKNINELSQAQNTYFFADPLSAVVKLSPDGGIKIEGAKTKWLYDVKPDADRMNPFIHPYILSGEWQLD